MKQLVLVLSVFVLFASVNMLSQDKKENTKTEMKECGDAKMDCCKTESKTKVSQKPWNEVCPVQGNKVSTKVATVTYENKEYGFCCGGCDKEFKKDPAKYSKKLSKDGKSLALK